MPARGGGGATDSISLRRRRTPKPRVRARVPPYRCPPWDPTCETQAAAGGDSEGDLQGGGGPVRCNPARDGGKAAVPANPESTRPLGPILPPRPADRWPRPRSPAAPGRPLPPACELGSRAPSAGAVAGNSSVLMTMAAGAGVRLGCPRRPPRH